MSSSHDNLGGRLEEHHGEHSPYRAGMTSGAAPAQGQVAIHVAGAMTTAGVRARVDGRQVELTLPTTIVTVAAGRHLVEVEGLQGFVTPFGEARTEVDVAPGQRAQVHYALPRTHLSAGRIGPTPQSRSWGPDWRNIAIGCGGAIVLGCLCAGGVTVWERLAG